MRPAKMGKWMHTWKWNDILPALEQLPDVSEQR